MSHRKQGFGWDGLRSVTTLTTLLLAACDMSPPPYALLKVEDPSGIATTARRLALGSDPANLTAVSLGGNRFPVTLTLTPKDAPERRLLWVDALDGDGVAVGRASVEITFQRKRTGSFTATLRTPCDSAAECDNALACDGAEMCTARVCAEGAGPTIDDGNPCTEDTCDELAGVVHTTPTSLDGNSCALDASTTGICKTGLCVAPSCGDGLVTVTAAEGCDDGNATGGDGCTACHVQLGWYCSGAPSTCSTVCGDGIIAGTETCDDNNDAGDDGCAAGCGSVEEGWSCSFQPSLCAPICGDGLVRGSEACDTTGESASCDSDCTLPECGDRHVNASATEACDDGNFSNTDGCLNTCVLASCGDTYVGPGEACDDGGVIGGCTENCALPTCGDGNQDPGEQCDLGTALNDDNGDCLTTCLLPTCGDGYVWTGHEDCDDQNTISFDGCSAQCRYIIWEQTLGGSVSGAGPTVSPDGTTVVVPTTDGIVRAYDTITGASRWSYNAGSAISSPVVVSSKEPLTNALYAVVTTSGEVHGVTHAGAAAWAAPFELNAPTNGAGLAFSGKEPSIVAVDSLGQVYGIDINGAAHCFVNEYGASCYPDASMLTGQPCQACTPTIAHPGAVFGWWGGEGLIIPLGEQVWIFDFNFNCPPLAVPLQSGERVLGQVVFVGNDNSQVGPGDRGYLTTTHGRVLQASYVGTSCPMSTVINWQYPTVGALSLATPPSVALTSTARAVFFGDLDGNLYRLDTPPVPTAPTWTYDAGSGVIVQPALDADANAALSTVYVGTEDGVVHAVNTTTGSARWTLALGAPLAGSAAVLGNAVYVVTTDAHLYALERGGSAPPYYWWARQGANNQGQSASSACTQSQPGAWITLLLCHVAMRSRRRWATAKRSVADGSLHP